MRGNCVNREFRSGLAVCTRTSSLRMWKNDMFLYTFYTHDKDNSEME